MQKKLSKLNHIEIPSLSDQELIKGLEMDLTRLELTPNFAEQLEAFPLLKKLWDRLQEQVNKDDDNVV